MTTNDRRATDWLAFQYAAGELRGRELTDFETRLESDENAQQALSQVVKLSLAISAARRAEITTAPRSDVRFARQSRRRWLGLAAGLAAAAAVLVACWFAMRGPGLPREVAPGDPAGEDPVRLAIMWSETRAALPSRDEWSSDDQPGAPVIASVDFPAVEDEPEPWTVAETPPWVWAAVSASLDAAQEQPSSDDPTDLGEI